LKQELEKNLDVIEALNNNLLIEKQKNKNYKLLIGEKDHLMKSFKNKFNRKQLENNSLKEFMESFRIFVEKNDSL
jgi:hypothetical protein